ncbi:MAG: MarR family winged helix-turn-helix transcriptional regulator [Thermomicrobiales bacterium]
MSDATSHSPHSCLQAWRQLRSMYVTVEQQLTGALDAACGLTPVELEALVLIGDQPDGVRPGDMGSGVGLSQPAISRMIDRLQKRGLVETSADPNDRRSVRVSLTSEGVTIAGQGMVVYTETILVALNAMLEPDRLQALYRAMAIPGR